MPLHRKIENSKRGGNKHQEQQNHSILYRRLLVAAGDGFLACWLWFPTGAVRRRNLLRDTTEQQALRFLAGTAPPDHWGQSF